MSALQAAAPADISALHALLCAHPGPVRYIAGGTDLLCAGGTLPASGLLLDISCTTGLSFIDAGGEVLRIGAATTLAALAEHPLLRRRLAALCEAAEQCGSVQIRNRATIGGNIANAAPAADLPPVLACAGARLELLEDGVTREVPLAGNRLRPRALVRSVIIPAAGLLPRSAFVKLGAREEPAIAHLSLAMMACYDAPARQLGELRLVAGALGPAPRRLRVAERRLRGRALSAAVLGGFLAALADEVDAAIPLRASRAYKRRAVTGLGLDLLARLTGLDPREPLFEEVLA